MALTEAQKLKLAQILGTDYIEVNDQVFNLGATYITAEVESQLQAQIDRWEAGAGTDFVKVEPDGSNKGVSIDPERERRDIRKNIANLLYMKGYGSPHIRLVRG